MTCEILCYSKNKRREKRPQELCRYNNQQGVQIDEGENHRAREEMSNSTEWGHLKIVGWQLNHFLDIV